MKEINKWNALTNKLTMSWIREYFEISLGEDVTFEWIGSEVGGVFEFADYYFNFNDILNCYKHSITKGQLFSWYDYCLTEPYIKISLTKFIFSPEERLKKEQKSLDESKRNLIFAEEEFKKALEKYKQ